MENKRPSIKQELDTILAVLGQFKSGASIEEVKTASGLDIELRTLQRRLKKLQEQGLITLSGKANAARYYLVPMEESQESERRGEIIPYQVPGGKFLNWFHARNSSVS
ncbi:hypothetical protein [Paraflavitalea speifideaquila]|uniref:hypothetical protein n=1 Tax=Paraflavitalea speifideaquila TaxID=3076558 RepID=UPI0028E5A406|nr:hypothetical protein [Paraflavitalea speifideiaquila]